MGNVGAAVSLVPSVILDLSVMRNRLFWPRRDGERLRGSVGIQPALSRDVLCAILTSLSALHFLRGAGGGAPGWQRDAVSTRSDGRRCRAEAKDGSRDRLRWRRRHARRAESVEERWEATALRHSRQETLSEARTHSGTVRMRRGLSLSLPSPPPPPSPPSPLWVPFLSSLIGKNPPTPFLLLLSYFLTFYFLGAFPLFSYRQKSTHHFLTFLLS